MIKVDFIKRKISLIQDDLTHLVGFKNYSFDEIAKDFVKQAALERILERVITRAIDINQHIIAELDGKDASPPKDYRDTFIILSKLNIYTKDFAEEISKSIGMRNILVHEYDVVDQQSIYDSVGDCLKDYHQYCNFILKFLEQEKYK